MSNLKLTNDDIGKAFACRKEGLTAVVLGYSPDPDRVLPVMVRYSNGTVGYVRTNGSYCQSIRSDYDLVLRIEHPEPAQLEPRPKDLRDEFAMVALQGILASYAGSTKAPDDERLAKYAYNLADAMMKEREARHE